MPSHYPFLLDPREHPDYSRRPIAVPCWDTFDNRTQFMTLRGFSQKDGLLVNFKEDIELYVRQFKLGRVIWPHYSTVQASNFPDLVAEIKRQGLYLFDIWGHVPGSSYEGEWNHFMPPPGTVEMLQRELGDHFLGFDNGEQDGRYIGGYANQQCPCPTDHFRQYLNFQRHFQRMCDDLGNHMSTLVSLCFGHYFLKEGNHVLIGAETAQALPNSQVYYSFIRGAGKQYGVHWFGNASVFNRWGWKNYGGEGYSEEKNYGPTCGTSLNLLKRLLYTHYLYNCVAVGFEQGWIVQDDVEKRLKGQQTQMEKDRTSITLTPVGTIQAGAAGFVEQHGQPGVMHAPVALLLDHFSGWTFPRHLYTKNVYVYQVWGGAPYQAGDYLTHHVLSVLYPGYEDASYYHDERGFLTPTPFGDMADCLLSDAPGWVMGQYGLIIVAGKLSIDDELRDKLEGFARSGGQVIVTAENARALWPQWEIGQPVQCPTGSVVRWADGEESPEQHAFGLCPVKLPQEATVRAACAEMPAVADIPIGDGRITLLLSPFAINSKPLLGGHGQAAATTVKPEVDKPLPCPFAMLAHARKALEQALTKQQIFSVGPGLGFITCRKEKGRYVLGIHNNALQAKSLDIQSRCGSIRSIVELPIDQSEKGAVGYWPQGFENTDAGSSGKSAIAGGDVRLFEVEIDERDVRVLSPAAPPPRVKDRMVAIRGMADLKESILRWPTFFQHFDGVKLDWTYLHSRDESQLRRERGWLERQKVRLVVDFSTGLNFYPDLTLLDTLDFRYNESVSAIDDVLDKMAALGAADAVISLHRIPENQCDWERASERFLACVKDLCRRASQRKIVLHMQHHPRKSYHNSSQMLQFIDSVGADNLRYALNVGHVIFAQTGGESLADILAAAGDRLGMILLCASRTDMFGQAYDTHAPIGESSVDLSAIRNVTTVQVLDADYTNWNEIYRDIRN